MVEIADWNQMTLGTLGEFRNGVNFSKDKKGSGLGLINVKDIFTDSPLINFETLDKVDLDGTRGIEKCHVKESDLYFVRSSVKRDGVGFVSMAPRDNNQAVHCGFVIRFRLTCPDVNPRFLLYILRSPFYRKMIIGISGGVAITNISQDVLKKLQVALPSFTTQRKIASILSTYDDLIENNLRRIRILEEMAQLIYREWFVNFRFPGHEKVEMVDSEQREIPKGWEVKKLRDVIELVYGKALKKDDRKGGPIPVYGSSGIIGHHNDALASGPGIIVGRKGNVGSVHWSETDFYPIDTVYYVKTELPLSYVFYNLQGQNFINSDAAVPGLSRNQAYTLPLLIPSQLALKQFHEKAMLIFSCISNLKS